MLRRVFVTLQMAIKNSQYNAALRLLSTAVDLKEVLALRSKDRNLLHILALYAAGNKEQQIRVCNLSLTFL